MNLQLAVLAGYALLQVALGLWMGRKVKSTGDFFVARRRLGPGLLFSTLVAANIGAGSTVGATGLGYRDGLGAWWWVGSAGIGSLILAIWVGPKIRKIAADKSLHTVGDYLELRYSRGCAAAWCCCCGRGRSRSWRASSSQRARSCTSSPASPWIGCMVGGVVMTAYFTAGGLMQERRGSMPCSSWSRSACTACCCPSRSRAPAVGRASSRAPPPDPAYWDMTQGWRYLILLAPAFIISPGQLQKVYGARDDKAVRWGVGLNGVLLLLFACVPALLGIVARALHPALPDHELALPTLLMSDLPPLGARLAAAFTTDVNTADAMLFMLSTSLSRDLYKGFLNPQASDAQVLKVARGAAVSAGVLGVAFAVSAPSVIANLTIFYTLLSVCLFVPILAGLFVPRVGQPEALAAVARRHRGHGRGPSRDSRPRLRDRHARLCRHCALDRRLRGHGPGSPPPDYVAHSGPPFRNGSDFPGNRIFVIPFAPSFNTKRCQLHFVSVTGGEPGLAWPRFPPAVESAA